MSAVVTSATPLMTDERLFSFFTWAPFVLAGLCVLAFAWRERGASSTGDEVAEAEWDAASVVSLDDRRRRADRG